MIAYLNDLRVNDIDTADYILSGSIQGLEIPTIRTSSDDYSGRSGGFMGAQFFGTRVVSLTGKVLARSLTLLHERRRLIQEALLSQAGTNSRDIPVTLRVITDAGNTYVLYCYLRDFQMPLDEDLFSANYKIDLLAPDPIIYDDTAGAELTATIFRKVGGGFTWPITWPLVWPVASGPTDVVNGGAVSILPKITLQGTMTNPVLTNTAYSEVFELEGLTTSPTDEVVIDMRERSVLLNGGSIFNKKTDESRWWSLRHGSNLIELATSSSDDDVTAIVSWRSGYMGI